jgi:hypothetical protein
MISLHSSSLKKDGEQVGRGQRAGRFDFVVFMWLLSRGLRRSGVVRPCLTYCVPPIPDFAAWIIFDAFTVDGGVVFYAAAEFSCATTIIIDP